MAIDDNTLYGLTGAQVKELPEKVTGKIDARIKTNAGAPTSSTAGTVGQLLEDTTNGDLYICTAVDTASTPATYTWSRIDAGGKAIKTLTTANYNYPANNPETVGLWLLSDGLYDIAPSTSVMIAGSEVRNPEQTLFAVYEPSGSGVAIITALNASPDDKSATYVVSKSDGTLYESGFILRDTMVADSLTSTSAISPLSAKQGKILNEKIEGRIKTNAGAPTTSTVGTVGQLLEDTTNGELYICTDATNPYVWESFTPGSPITVLTSADYDYDPQGGTNYTGVALWRLPAGTYQWDWENVNVYIVDSPYGHFGNEPGTYIVTLFESQTSTISGQTATFRPIYGQVFDPTHANEPVDATIAAGYMLTDGSGANIVPMWLEVQNNLNGGTDSQMRALSAYQGKVLNDKIEGRIKTNAGAPTAATAGTVGQILEDTTNGKLYICTAVTPGVAPDPDTYTWKEAGADDFRVLTSADYNWNTTAGDATTTPFDAVAMWLMPAGNYQWDTVIQPITVILDPSGTIAPAEPGMVGSFIFTRGATQHFVIPAQSVEGDIIPIIMYNTGQLYDEYSTYSGRIEIANGNVEARIYLNGKRAINSVAYTQSDAPERALSAQMGKYLNDETITMIKRGTGAPTTSTAGSVGRIYEDTTNGEAYICTAVSGNTYTWEKITKASDIPTFTMTTTDPGEGQPLAANNFIAVYEA